MRQNRVHLMPPMSNFYARICVKATPSSNNTCLLRRYKRKIKKSADLYQGGGVSPNAFLPFSAFFL